MGWGVQAILWIGRTVSSWPAATLAVPPMPPWGLAVFSFGLAWLGLWRTRWRLLGVLPMLAGLLSPLAVPAPDLLVSNDARLIALRGRRLLLAAATVGSLEVHAGGVGEAPRFGNAAADRRRRARGVHRSDLPARPGHAAAR